MRIAYILLQYPKESETFVRAEISELRKKHDVEVFSIFKMRKSSGSAVSAEKDFSVVKFIKWALYLLPKSWRDIKYIPYAIWLSRRLKDCDHVHTWFSASSATIAYIAATEANAQFSFSAHSRDIFVNRESDSLRKDKIRKAKFVLVPSRWHRNYMTKRFGLASKYHIIPNSIDTRKFTPGKERKKNQVIFIGRDMEKKGLKYLDAAMQAVPECKAVYVKGGLSEKELIKKLRESNALVMPSIIAKDNDSDGLPTTIMEAMSCGLPVIATDIRALPEMVNGCGLIVEPKNPDALAKSIKKLLSNRKLAERLGRVGRRRAIERFDIVKNTAKLERLIGGKR